MSQFKGYEVVHDRPHEQLGFSKLMRNIFATLTILLIIAGHPPCPCTLFFAPFFTATGIAWWLYHQQYKSLLKRIEEGQADPISDDEIAASVTARKSSPA